MAAAGLTSVAAPSAAAADATKVYLEGTDMTTWFEGTVSFTNRSASVVGELRVGTFSCLRLYGATYTASGKRLDYRSTSLHCDDHTWPTIPLNADVVGGAASVGVWIEDSTGRYLDGCTVKRGELPSCLHG